MVQRVVVVASLVVTLASLSLLSLVWHASNQAVNAAAEATRRLAETQTTSQAKVIELLTSSQSTSAEVLKQLQAIAKAAQTPRASDFVALSFKLTLETPDGPPAAGYEVTLQKGSRSLFEQGIHRESDAAGLVDFGVVQPGDWEFELTRSRDEQYSWKCDGSINVLPGAKLVKTIVCPGPRTVHSAVKLRVPWPPDLAEKNLRMEITFVQAPTEFQPPWKWTLVDSDGLDRRWKVLCEPGPKQIEIVGATKLDLWKTIDPSPSSSLDQPVFGDLHCQRVRAELNTVAMETGRFVPVSLIVLRPWDRQNAATKGERFEVLAHAVATVEIFSREVKTYSTDPDHSEPPLSATFLLAAFKSSVTVAPSYWRELEGRFSVQAGQESEWTIPLPQELLGAVRARLERKPDPQARQPHPGAGPYGLAER